MANLTPICSAIVGAAVPPTLPGDTVAAITADIPAISAALHTPHEGQTADRVVWARYAAGSLTTWPARYRDMQSDIHEVVSLIAAYSDLLCDCDAAHDLMRRVCDAAHVGYDQ